MGAVNRERNVPGTTREHQDALRALSIYRVGFRIGAKFEGVVKWYDTKKKYGYVTISYPTVLGMETCPVKGMDVFIHASNIDESNTSLNPQELLTFEFIVRQPKGWQAQNVKRMKNDPSLGQRASALCDNPEFLDPYADRDDEDCK